MAKILGILPNQVTLMRRLNELFSLSCFTDIYEKIVHGKKQRLA